MLTGTGSRTRISALIAGVVCAAASLTVPGPAAAGVYKVAQCHGTIPGPLQAVGEQTSSGYGLENHCATGGADAGLWIEHGPLASTDPGTHGRWTWHAAAGTVFTRVEATASLVSTDGEQARLVGVTAGGQQVPFGAPGDPWEPTDQITRELTQFRSELRCAAAGGCGIPLGAAGHAYVRDVVLTTDDRVAPEASIGGGSMFEATAVRGVRTVAFQVSDQGSGVHDLQLRVNDAPVYADVLACQVSGDFATALRPCEPQAGATVSLDTSAGPFDTGANRVTVCGGDLALDSLANAACTNRDVFVDNLCPSSPVGAGSRLEARFVRGKSTARVRSDQRARLRGKLLSDSGDGIAGATVCALTRAKLGGEPYEVADTATTGTNGDYSLRLPAGPSREVFVHRVFTDDVLARHGLSTNSSVRPSFEVTPGKGKTLKNGDRLTFSGKLPGPSCADRLVKVQAKVGKDRWQVFRNPRTGDGCRYTARYKLRATSKPTKYRFRVRVPEQGDYPYDAGVSTVRARKAGPGGRS